MHEFEHEMVTPELPAQTRTWFASVKTGLWAMVVVSVWILLLCTAPQILGNALWRNLGWTTDLPFRHITQVALHSVVVVVALLLTGRRALLVPRRPRSLIWLGLLVPLAALNFARGPLANPSLAFVLAVFVATFLTGFWEEFLFRGLIQERLSVLGARASLVVPALLFGLIHAYAGWWKVFVAFSIGLIFSLARDRVGMWALVVVHCLIDLSHDLFLRRWEHANTVGAWLVVGYFVLGVALLIRLRAR